MRHRVALTSLKKPNDIDQLESQSLRAKLNALIGDATGKSFTEQLVALSERKDIPAKVVKQERLSGITVPLKGAALSPDPDRRPAVPAKFYKGDSNYCYEIFVGDNGKWDGEIISTFVANQNRYREFMNDRKHFLTTAFCGKPLVMRLTAGDCLKVVQGNEVTLLRVQNLSDGMITMCPPVEANVDQRNRNKADPFKYTYKSPSALQKIHASPIRIDILGRVISR